MKLVGMVRDIQPNAIRPTLELSFDSADRANFPQGDRVSVTLEIGGVIWHGTMRTDSSHPPYFHARLTTSDGQSSSTCTDELLKLGLAEKARLAFWQDRPGALRLEGIVDSGSWRPGNEPEIRKARSPSTSKPRGSSSPSGQRQVKPSASTSAGFPFEDRDAILELARAYWELISPREVIEERAFESEMIAERRRRALSKAMFVRLARWKSVRKTHDYEANSEAAVRIATANAFQADDDASALRSLISLDGVAVRTASAILHWLCPDRYPILDFRVLAALGEPEPSSYENPALYTRIADRVRALAARHALDLRTIDRALWAWDKARAS